MSKRPANGTAASAEKSHPVSRYTQVAKARQTLLEKLRREIPKKELVSLAKELEAQELLGEASDDAKLQLLYDFCLHEAPPRRTSHVQKALLASKGAAASTERRLLEAMLDARLAVLSVLEVSSGVGVRARDSLRNQDLDVVDVELAESLHEGDAFAARLIRADALLDGKELFMTTGATLQVPSEVPELLAEFAEESFGKEYADIIRLLPRDERGELHAMLLKVALEPEDGADED